MNYIYCITNLINNKRYVGKTTLLIEERFREHCKDSQKERCEKRPLYDAMNKYGIENFKVECLEEIEKALESYNFLKDKEVYVKASVKITFSKKDAEYIYFDSDQDMRDWVDGFISKYGKNYISI